MQKRELGKKIIVLLVAVVMILIAGLMVGCEKSRKDGFEAGFGHRHGTLGNAIDAAVCSDKSTFEIENVEIEFSFGWRSSFGSSGTDVGVVLYFTNKNPHVVFPNIPINIYGIGYNVDDFIEDYTDIKNAFFIEKIPADVFATEQFEVLTEGFLFFTTRIFNHSQKITIPQSLFGTSEGTIYFVTFLLRYCYENNAFARLSRPEIISFSYQRINENTIRFTDVRWTSWNSLYAP